MNLTLGECSTYLRETKGQVYEVWWWHSRFISKLKIPELKTKLSKKFKVYKTVKP